MTDFQFMQKAQPTVALFVSDLHLQAALPRTTQAFLSFLQSHAVRTQQLYLLGDVFEYWAGDDDRTAPYNQLIADALRTVQAHGVQLYWMAGNRDFLVGDALLAYLRRGRPVTDAREIFVHTKAPYRSFSRGSSLYLLVRLRLEGAAVSPAGKCGPHTFRHARAVSLLRASATTKTIGDLLGHRSAESTRPYLKLATDDLRDVALEIPGQEVQA